MNRRPALGLLALSALALLTAAPAGAAELTMRLSHPFPPTHHTALNLVQFEKDVEAATNGEGDVQIFGAAQPFKPNQHLPMPGFQWGGTIPEMSVTITRI